MKKAKVVKKTKKSNEPIVTDVSREYFEEKGIPMVKISEYVGKKPTSVKTIPSSEE